MDYINLLGVVAGFLTTVSFLPQAFKAWKTKSTKDISINTFLILFTGMFLWAIYGFLINSIPVLAANGVSVFIALSIIIMKFRYG